MATEFFASELHKSSLVIDSHNDAIVAYLLRKGGEHRRARLRRPARSRRAL